MLCSSPPSLHPISSCSTSSIYAIHLCIHHDNLISPLSRVSPHTYVPRYISTPAPAPFLHPPLFSPSDFYIQYGICMFCPVSPAALPAPHLLLYGVILDFGRTLEASLRSLVYVIYVQYCISWTRWSPCLPCLVPLWLVDPSILCTN